MAEFIKLVDFAEVSEQNIPLDALFKATGVTTGLPQTKSSTYAFVVP